MVFGKDLIRGVAEPIVLSLVAERPMYGYEIIQVVNERSGNAFQWKEGTLYPCLHRLEAAGIIKGSWQTAASGKRRKYYAITRKGKGLLQDKADEWMAFSKAVTVFLRSVAPVRT